MGLYSRFGIIRNKRRRKTRDYGVAGFKKIFAFLSFIHYLLRILWTDDKALTAKYALIADNVCLIS